MSEVCARDETSTTEIALTRKGTNCHAASPTPKAAPLTPSTAERTHATRPALSASSRTTAYGTTPYTAYPTTAGKPPRSMDAKTSARGRVSRQRRRQTTRSTAQKSRGTSAATRVCGQLVQAIMNPDDTNTRALTARAAEDSPRRRVNRAIPTTDTTISTSLAAPGA